MKKMFFFDIDGTLLDHSIGMVEPNVETIEALKSLKSAGHKIAIATARTHLPTALATIPFDAVILANGHHVSIGNNVIINDVFNGEQLEKIAWKMREHGGAYTMGGPMVNVSELFDQQFLPTYQHLQAAEIIKNIGKSYKEAKNVTMVTAHFKSLKAMKLFILNFPTDWIFHEYVNDPIHYDIHLPGHTKGSAVAFVYGTLGFEKSNTYAFGDGRNDLEMMKLVGTSIAMDNGDDKIKEIATKITGPVSDNGVVTALKQMRYLKKQG